ncbi:MAG: ImmA/IrrE family metallo-endopeptidase [Leptolyngbyaceae cyanobacterium MO_188.B28]|nr:ImmA/IrrE family metallo-endopeptidase [Leptolyngbyaceae cyanobacterium MO_188.B28]
MSQPDLPRPYRHPGHAFLSGYDCPEAADLVMPYVSFLRSEAGLSDDPPIDLAAIYRHFGMPEPRRAPLVDQQGILVDGNAGLILIKEDDPVVRQRFTEGHELMELLFDAQEQVLDGQQPGCRGVEKERWCDRGAAELLMPGSSFAPRVRELGMSLQTGQTLANLYTTSLIATLLHMIQHTSGSHALVMWRKAHSRRDLAGIDANKPLPPKKLRVWWRSCSPSWTGGFIPKNKSIAQRSLIAKTYKIRQSHTGSEQINLGYHSIHCDTETMPIQIGDQFCVLSILNHNV